GNQKEEDRILLDMIASQSSSMKEQLDQILMLNREDTFSGDELNPTQLCLETFTKGFLSDFSKFAQQKGINYKITNIVPANSMLELDKGKLKTILKNIIANALKFTPSGGSIALSIQTIEERLIFQIKDTGRGIPSSSIAHVFERFYQVPNKNQEGGSGIGLAICKRYTEQMGGKIAVESKEGEGSTFSISLPFKRLEVRQEKVQASLPIRKLELKKKVNSSKKKADQPLILLAEDHSQMSNYLELMLKDKFRIQKSRNGLEAINYLKEGDIPNLIISDVMMPEMDGWEFAKELRGHKIWRKIPLIILTANNEQENKLSFLRIGVDDYLVKPFVEEELLARIENLLSNYQIREDYLKQNSKSGEAFSLIDKELNDYDRQWMEKLLNIIEPLLPNFDLKIDHISEKMALSNVQLYRKVKAFTGQTTMQFIQNLRFEKAKKMLESDPNVPIKVVSYSVGFKSEKHFSRNFKKRYGVSPSVYKNS
ncbi:MAG: ATP-binding protein, partial [Bacteroidota bacterium]